MEDKDRLAAGGSVEVETYNIGGELGLHAEIHAFESSNVMSATFLISCIIDRVLINVTFGKAKD